jgi:hypothetical protein
MHGDTLCNKIRFIVKCEICRRGGYTQKLSNPTDRPFDIPTQPNLYLCRPQSRHESSLYDISIICSMYVRPIIFLFNPKPVMHKEVRNLVLIHSLSLLPKNANPS